MSFFEAKVLERLRNMDIWLFLIFVVLVANLLVDLKIMLGG